MEGIPGVSPSWELKLSAIRTRIAVAKQRRDWNAMDEAAEEGLAVNPWDTDFNLELARACDKQGFHDVALFACDCALAAAPDRTDVRDFHSKLTSSE